MDEFGYPYICIELRGGGGDPTRCELAVMLGGIGTDWGVA